MELNRQASIWVIQHLNEHLTQAPILRGFDPGLETKLHTDASHKGIAGRSIRIIGI